MNKSIHYKCFNLIFESKDIILQELKKYNGPKKCDVVIKKENPEKWPELGLPFYKSDNLSIYKNELRLFIENVGCFRISNGNFIGWYAYAKNITNYIRTYLLGSVMGALLIQRDELLLHGNALTKKGETIICLGNSGAGKSTLAYSLMLEGWELLADDLVTIRDDKYILPGIPRIKLFNDAMDHFSLEQKKSKKISNDYEKYLVDGEFIKPKLSPSKLTHIYLLIRGGEKVVIKDIFNEVDKFYLINQNTFRPKYIKFLGKEGIKFKKICQLVRNIPLSIISFPNSKIKLCEWAENF